MSQDAAYLQRRYLIMIGIRAVRFIVGIVMFVNRAGALAALPVVGAIYQRYFAVVMGNGGAS
jgi:hypothetical protein